MAKQVINESIKPTQEAPSFSTSTIEESLNSMGVTISNGLSTSEVARLAEKYGPNQLQEAFKWFSIN
jgi:uncharacterized protein YgiM (DUF1202 family)